VLGTKGHLATHYGVLLKELWSGKPNFAPVQVRTNLCVLVISHVLQFRKAIVKHAPQFDGRLQHDSQELLAFVLDGLHEDLNRVISKPYVERKDSDGRPDEIVAAEHWENHCKRNRSVIVDSFHGQLRSQLRCVECEFVSVTFDPFTFLSLSLPVEFGSIMVCNPGFDSFYSFCTGSACNPPRFQSANQISADRRGGSDV
jgi:ubiquitin carboxyl-terminal hydrolase 6/32